MANDTHTMLVTLFSSRATRTAQPTPQKHVTLRNSFVFDENNQEGSI